MVHPSNKELHGCLENERTGKVLGAHTGRLQDTPCLRKVRASAYSIIFCVLKTAGGGGVPLIYLHFQKKLKGQKCCVRQ